MKLTKDQIAQLSKWAKEGRLIVRPLTPDLPEWAKHEFHLARVIVSELAWLSNSVSRGTLSVSPEMEAEAKANRVKRYTEGNRKAWVTRKRQKLAREAAKAEAGKIDQEAA